MLGHLIPMRLASNERWSVPARRDHMLEKAFRGIKLPHLRTEVHHSTRETGSHFRFLAAFFSRFR